MPPKKGGDGPKQPPLIGRFGTSLKIGIVGLPNVGKSTFFNVLTKSQAAAENFPFCTIDPNESRVPIPDERYDFLCQYHKPASKVPAFLNVVDIAGLVKGAHAGQGLGNAFLSHISACDSIFHMTRAFEDEDIIHVEGCVDPVRDIEIIHEELRMKDEEMIGPIIDKLEKTAVRGGDKKLKPEYDIMCKIKSWVVDEKKHVRYYHEWNDKEIEVLNKYLFLTSKPMIYLVNLSEKDYIRKKNKWLVKIKEWVDTHDPGALVIPFSGGFESKYQDMTTEEFSLNCDWLDCTSRHQSQYVSVLKVAAFQTSALLAPKDMTRKCLYPQCNNTKVLHGFPRDPVRARLWLQAAGCWLNVSTYGKYVCSLHFKPECYENFGLVNSGYGGHLSLKQDAVPTPITSSPRVLPNQLLLVSVSPFKSVLSAQQHALISHTDCTLPLFHAP